MAREKYRALMRGTWSPWHTPPPPTTIEDAFTAYDAHNRAVTSDHYRGCIDSCLRGSCDTGRVTRSDGLSRLTSGVLQAYIHQERFAQATKASYYRHLHALFAWCVRADLLEANPMDAVDRPRTPKPLPRALDAAQLARLLEASPPPLRAFYGLIAWTGLRPSEVLRLRPEDILPGHIIVRSRRQARTKTDTERAVTIVPQARRYLERVGTWTHTVDYSGKKFRKIREVCSLPAHLTQYSLRHTYAAEYRRRGGSLAMLQGELGHSTIRVTEQYGHLGIGEQAAYTSRLFGEDMGTAPRKRPVPVAQLDRASDYGSEESTVLPPK